MGEAAIQQRRDERVTHELQGPVTHRMVIEIDARLIDPSWTEQDLRDNAVDYIDGIIDKAERHNHERFPNPSYRLATGDITLWTCRADYLADILDQSVPLLPESVMA